MRADEDQASLQAIANASGGKYVTAASAEELREALAENRCDVIQCLSWQRGSCRRIAWVR